jgi:hypothetical protein
MRLVSLLLCALLLVAPGCARRDREAPTAGKTTSVKVWQKGWNRALAQDLRQLAADIRAGTVTTAAEMKRRIGQASLDRLDEYSAGTADVVTSRSQPDGKFDAAAAAAAVEWLADNHGRAGR